jgi:kinetochore protein NNF1
LNAKLEESAKAEFEEIIAEREVVPHLNELDRLVGEARVRREQEEENGDSERTVYVGSLQHSLTQLWMM